jgi:hypothetical protein
MFLFIYFWKFGFWLWRNGLIKLGWAAVLPLGKSLRVLWTLSEVGRAWRGWGLTGSSVRGADKSYKI